MTSSRPSLTLTPSGKGSTLRPRTVFLALPIVIFQVFSSFCISVYASTGNIEGQILIKNRYINKTGFLPVLKKTYHLLEKGTTLDCRNVFHMFHSNAQYKVILHLTITQYQLCNLGHFYLTPS